MPNMAIGSDGTRRCTSRRPARTGFRGATSRVRTGRAGHGRMGGVDQRRAAGTGMPPGSTARYLRAASSMRSCLHRSQR